jgi:hypothetical protein
VARTLNIIGCHHFLIKLLKSDPFFWLIGFSPLQPQIDAVFLGKVIVKARVMVSIEVVFRLLIVLIIFYWLI